MLSLTGGSCRALIASMLTYTQLQILELSSVNSGAVHLPTDRELLRYGKKLAYEQQTPADYVAVARHLLHDARMRGIQLMEAAEAAKAAKEPKTKKVAKPTVTKEVKADPATKASKAAPVEMDRNAEARVKELKGKEAAELCVKNKIPHEPHPTNAGISAMRAKNALVAHLKAGKKITGLK